MQKNLPKQLHKYHVTHLALLSLALPVQDAPTVLAPACFSTRYVSQSAVSCQLPVSLLPLLPSAEILQIFIDISIFLHELRIYVFCSTYPNIYFSLYVHCILMYVYILFVCRHFTYILVPTYSYMYVCIHTITYAFLCV